LKVARKICSAVDLSRVGSMELLHDVLKTAIESALRVKVMHRWHMFYFTTIQKNIKLFNQTLFPSYGLHVFGNHIKKKIRLDCQILLKEIIHLHQT
jgi:hypothetical protein